MSALPIHSVSTRRPMVALTYDDGPSGKSTLAISAVLKRFNATATFFCVGQQIMARPEVIRHLLDEGHEIGNHGFSHRRLSRMNIGEIRMEITKTDLLLRAMGSAATPVFRAPYAEHSARIATVLASSGRRNVLFDCESKPPDFKRPPSLQISCSIARQAKNGSIIVLHDGGKARGGVRKETIEATEQLLDYFQRNQIRVVTVSELLSHR